MRLSGALEVKIGAILDHTDESPQDAHISKPEFTDELSLSLWCSTYFSACCSMAAVVLDLASFWYFFFWFFRQIKVRE